jgi:hypothetical protein
MFRYSFVHLFICILPNECPDQLETHAVRGSSCGSETITPPNEPGSEEEFAMADEDISQSDDWTDPEHLPPTRVPMFSTGIAAEEEREQQEQLFRRFQPSQASEVVQVSRYIPRMSTDESDGDMPVPDLDDSGVVQGVSGNGFQIVDPLEATEATWTVAHIPIH